jgi:hypothetical protein
VWLLVVFIPIRAFTLFKRVWLRLALAQFLLLSLTSCFPWPFLTFAIPFHLEILFWLAAHCLDPLAKAWTRSSLADRRKKKKGPRSERRRALRQRVWPEGARHDEGALAEHPTFANMQAPEVPEVPTLELIENLQPKEDNPVGALSRKISRKGVATLPRGDQWIVRTNEIQGRWTHIAKEGAEAGSYKMMQCEVCAQNEKGPREKFEQNTYVGDGNVKLPFPVDSVEFKEYDHICKECVGNGSDGYRSLTVVHKAEKVQSRTVHVSGLHDQRYLVQFPYP